MDYFKLGEKSAGVASVFGALQPGSEILPLPRAELGPNALNANFIHMIRDLNGEYSFEVAPYPGRRETIIRLKCKVKGVKIRLPRTVVPWPVLRGAERERSNGDQRANHGYTATCSLK